MQRRNIVRLVSFLSVGIVVIAGIALKESKKNQRLMLQIENNYSRNLNELSESLNNVSLILKKARFTTSPQQLSRLSAELLTESEISKNALSQLPEGARFEALNRFLSQVGNYAFSVAGELYDGKEIPDNYKTNMLKLSKTAQRVANIVDTAKISYDNADYWASEINSEIKEEVGDSLSASFEQIEGEFTDYPTLVYDGPYSDHLLTQKPYMLENAKIITEVDAKKIATDFLNINSKELSLSGHEKGKIEAFHFRADSLDITVSRKGGHIVYMRKAREIGKYALSYETAVEKAKEFLSERGFDSFVETYYFTDEGVCVINFAFLDGKTICYTDLLKVGVAMDDGEIVLFEAGGYIANHKPRAFQSAVYTVDEAKQKLSSELKIQKTAIALIPTKKGKEERCYEFTCTDGENEILVYINLLNLDEEEILILLRQDGGTLVK